MWIDNDSCEQYDERVSYLQQCRFAIGPDAHTHDESMTGWIIMDDDKEFFTLNSDQGSQTVMNKVDDFGWGKKEPKNTKYKWSCPDVMGLQGLYCWELTKFNTPWNLFI